MQLVSKTQLNLYVDEVVVTALAKLASIMSLRGRTQVAEVIIERYLKEHYWGKLDTNDGDDPPSTNGAGSTKDRAPKRTIREAGKLTPRKKRKQKTGITKKGAAK